MDNRSYSNFSIVCVFAALAVLVGGCRESSNSKGNSRPESEAPAAPAQTVGPASSAVRVDMSLGWCAGHGVPESVCTRCNASLIPKFKAAGDWCAEHGLPESQCTVCNPGVAGAWEQLNPENKAQGPNTSGVAVDMSLGWCGGHGVPESVCTRCNPALISQFKNANDWCAAHGLPESQCAVCNPEVAEHWAALNPGVRRTPKAPAERSDVVVERIPRLLTGKNDPLCPVESLRVRFIDPSIIRKAGIGVEPVRRRRMSSVIDVPAEVEFDATRVTRVTPRVDGVVLEVIVQQGREVQPGDLLAVVDSPALGEAKSLYIERVQNLRLAEADHERVRTIFSGAHRMLDVCTPESPAKKVREALSESPVGSDKAKLLRAHAALQLARAGASRESQLLEQKLSSERDYEAARSVLASAEADFAAIREEIAFDIERRRIETERGVEVAASALDAAERRLHILGLGDHQIAAIGQESDELLSRYELHSPVAGRVIERRIAAGESVEASDIVFVVADNTTMWLVANIYERELIQLQLGLPVIFTVDGLSGVSFEGRISWISSQVDDRTRTVRLRTDLPNPDGLLRAKMFGSARIVLHDDDAVLSVPADAVQSDACCQLVFVQQSETVFEPRKVLLGTSSSGYVEILKGIKENEAVASTGSFLMKTEILKSNIGAGCCEVDPGR